MSDSGASAASFLLRLGRLALEAGADTEQTRRLVDDAASASGARSELFIGSERLLVMIDGMQSRVRIGHAINGFGINAGRLAALKALVRDLHHEGFALSEASRRLVSIESDQGSHPGWLVIVAVAGTAAALSRLFGAVWPVVGVSFIVGLISTVLRRRLAASRFNGIAGSFLTALLSGVAGVLLLRLTSNAAPALCLTAAGMILVPGVPLINAVSDLVHGHPSMGIARLVTSITMVLAIAAGLFLATGITGTRLPVLEGPGSVSLPEDVLFSAIAALGYTLLFNVNARAIWIGVLCGVLTHSGRTLLEGVGLDVSSATLICAFCGGALACGFGRWLAVPWTAFAFPGVVAMIPGSYAFRGAIGCLQIMVDGPASPAAIVSGTLSVLIAAMVMTIGIGIGLMSAYAMMQTFADQDRRM
jgi:uncharacterized membrane protein YjjP (DUF1212 family)